MSDVHSDALVFFGAAAIWRTRRLFAPEDYVEEAWRIVDPVLKGGPPVYEYEPGTWGPKEVDSSVSPPGGSQNATVRVS